MTRKPRLFIGSSVEGLPIANAIQENLDYDAEVTVWQQGVFELSAGAVDSLLRVLDTTDFGVFVFNADDIVRLRGTEHAAVRDNVVFELGMFIGKLGRQRSFVILPRGQTDLHLPSDLAGLTPADFEPNRSDGNLQAALGAACNQVRRAIEQLGPVTARAAVLKPQDPRDLVMAGVLLGTEYIAKAIGPQGVGMAVTLSSGRQIVTKAGSMIARGIQADGLEGRGVNEIRELTQEMDDSVGDGAKIAALLFAKMAEEGVAALRAGHLPRHVAEGMRRAVDAAAAGIVEMSSETFGKAELEKVATTAGQSRLVGQLIVDAMEYAGKDGIITVQESDVHGPRLERVEGVRLDHGYISHYFAANAPDARVEFDDCYILTTTERITSMSSILDLLEGVASTNRPLLLIAADVDGDALTTLIVNVQRGGLRSVAVRFPANTSRYKAVLEDLSILTGATLITADVGLTLERATLGDLGRAKHVIVEQDSTTILEGAGDPAKIALRATAIRNAMRPDGGSYDQDFLYERVARLNGQVANILVGGITPSDVLEAKYQFTSAMHSARKAVESGFVAGGGVALLLARASLGGVQPLNAGEAAGLDAVDAALQTPTRALVATARRPVDEILHEIEGRASDGIGFDSVTGEVLNVREAGIYDPSATLVRALETAFSHARQVLLTEAWDL